MWPVVPDAGRADRVGKLCDELSRYLALVHCASAVRIEDDDLVAATGDVRLLQAWAALGIATYDPSRVA